MSMYVNGRRTAPVIGVGQGTPIEVDEELSKVSENPVQNKAITEKFEQFEESVSDRFESLGSEIDEHFATLEQSIDDRFDELGSELDERFQEVYDTIDALGSEVDEKFQEVYDTIEALGSEVDEHFERVEASVEDLDERKVNKADFLTLLDAYELWYGVESSESSEEEPVPFVLKVTDIPETLLDDAECVVEGNVVTLKTDKICKVGYEDVDGYVALEAVKNEDGSHSFTVPEGIEEVFVVMKGDANLDGNITMEDANMMLASIHGGEPLTGLNFFAADINNNGVIVDSDAIVISIMASKDSGIDW